jgi:hypothetical protein
MDWNAMTMWLIGGALLCGLVALAAREIRWRRISIPEGCRNLGPCNPARPVAGEPVIVDDKLSIVLPIKIRVHHQHSELERVQRLLLPSLQKFLALDDVHEFLIIAPPGDIEEVRKGVEPFAAPLRIRVLADTDLAPRVEGMKSGWAKQQILKLAAANLVQTKHYLVFDTDNLMVSPAGFQQLCPGGRARVTREPYRIHPRWWRMSSRMLRYSFKFGPGFSGPTTTPQILHTQICREAQREIEIRNGKAPWECLLASYRGWSEYTLCWLYMLKHYEAAELYDDAVPLHRECIWHGADELTPEFIGSLFDSGDVPFTVLQSRIRDLGIGDIHALVRPYIS